MMNVRLGFDFVPLDPSRQGRAVARRVDGPSFLAFPNHTTFLLPSISMAWYWQNTARSRQPAAGVRDLAERVDGARY